MNKTVNKSLLPGNNFMSKLHLKYPRFTYSVCRTFTKRPQRIRIFRETGNSKHLYRNAFDRACFAHETAYCDSS